MKGTYIILGCIFLASFLIKFISLIYTDGLEIGITMGKDSIVFYKKGKDFKSKWKFAFSKDL